MFEILLIYGASILGTVVAHELIHYMMAVVLGVKCKVQICGLTPYVEYTASTSPLNKILISVAPSITLVTIGSVIPCSEVLLALKIMCLVNLFNILPFASDGEVVIYSVMEMLRKKKRKIHED